MGTSFSVNSGKVSFFNLVSSNSNPIRKTHSFLANQPYAVFRATVFYSDKNGNMKSLDVRTEKETTHKVHESAVTAFKVENKRLCTSSDTVKVWNLKDENPFSHLFGREIDDHRPHQIAFNGAIVFTSEKGKNDSTKLTFIYDPKQLSYFTCDWLGLICGTICLTHIHIGTFTEGIHVFDSRTETQECVSMKKFLPLCDSFGFCNDQFIMINKEKMSDGTRWILEAYHIYVSQNSHLFADFFNSVSDSDQEAKIKSAKERPQPVWTYTIQMGDKDIKFSFSKDHFVYMSDSTAFIVWPGENRIADVVCLYNTEFFTYKSYVFIKDKSTLSLLKTSYYDGKKPSADSLIKVSEYQGNITDLKVTDGILYFEDSRGLNTVDYKETEEQKNSK